MKSLALWTGAFLLSLTWSISVLAVLPSADNPQGAVWRLREAGQHVEANAAEKHLINVLTTSPLNNIASLGSGGSESYLVRFPGQIFAVLKGSDPEVPESYDNEVLAYRLDRLFDLNMVPITVHRTVGKRVFSLQLYYPKGLRGEHFTNDASLRAADLYFFDAFMSNEDRGLEARQNVFVGEDGRLVLIDHGRTFQYNYLTDIDPTDIYSRPTKEFQKKFMQATEQDIIDVAKGLQTNAQISMMREKLISLQHTLQKMPQEFVSAREVVKPLDKVRPFKVPDELKNTSFYDRMGALRVLRMQSGEALSPEALALIASNLPVEAKELISRYMLERWDQWTKPFKKQILDILWPEVFIPLATLQPSLVGEILRIKPSAFDPPRRTCSSIFGK